MKDEDRSGKGIRYLCVKDVEHFGAFYGAVEQDAARYHADDHDVGHLPHRRTNELKHRLRKDDT